MKTKKKIISDAANLFGGKDIYEEDLHESVKEHLLASEYGWTLEYVRNLGMKEFKEHFLICLIKKKAMQKQAEAFAGINAIRNSI